MADVGGPSAAAIFLSILGTALGTALTQILRANTKRLKEADKTVPWSASQPPPAMPQRAPRTPIESVEYVAHLLGRQAELERQRDELGARLNASELERHKAVLRAEEHFTDLAEERAKVRQLNSLLAQAKLDHDELYTQIRTAHTPPERGHHAANPDARAHRQPDQADLARHPRGAGAGLPRRRGVAPKKHEPDDH